MSTSALVPDPPVIRHRSGRLDNEMRLSRTVA